MENGEWNMKITILGAAGFIGTNLALKLVEDTKNEIVLIDEKKEYFDECVTSISSRIRVVECNIGLVDNFDDMLAEQDLVYHLYSSSIPSTSNLNIGEELSKNISVSAKILDSSVKGQVKKVVFISSGGTVYGNNVQCPIIEDSSTNPISAYGLQKLMIEKMLYVYNNLYGLDYAVVRLANPYGPYQRPNGALGAVTTFSYKALTNERIVVYGDGSVIRDFIYIDDAIKAVLNIANNSFDEKIFNIGSGKGTSIKQILGAIEGVLNEPLNITYEKGRMADVPTNYLDVSRYEKNYGRMNFIELEEGIEKTMEFLKIKYSIGGW